jgi:hypothetical protein
MSAHKDHSHDTAKPAQSVTPSAISVAELHALSNKITALQASPGAKTPEDRLLIDDICSRADALANKNPL